MSGDQRRGGAGKKEAVLNLEKFLDKAIHVKFHGGREVTGILKGCDTLMNLVLDQATEYRKECRYTNGSVSSRML